MIEWSWRVERPRSIYFGSESGPRAIAHRLQTLQGLVVEDISVDGRLPEVTLRLSGGHWVRSFSTVESQPEWCLFFRHPDLPRHSVSSSRGKLYIGTA